MRCPLCGASSETISTRTGVKGGVTRRRKCKSGHRFTTQEVVVRADEEKLPGGRPPYKGGNAIWAMVTYLKKGSTS